MRGFLGFGEEVDGYGVRVLNERAVRAGAGILFFLAIVAFMNAWLTGNFHPTRVFVVAFLIDFTLRIFINPRYAPSLIVGQWMVRQQQPEWTGAPQKRFAWAIGFALALAMLYLVVLNRVVGPVNLIVCATCLILMFFEAAFGICLGCKIYGLLNREKAQLCPGGTCETLPAKTAGGGPLQLAIVLLFALAVSGIARWIYSTDPDKIDSPEQFGESAPAVSLDPAEVERCKVPDFAKALGHEAMWKLHNNCK